MGAPIGRGRKDTCDFFSSFAVRELTNRNPLNAHETAPPQVASRRDSEASTKNNEFYGARKRSSNSATQKASERQYLANSHIRPAATEGRASDAAGAAADVQLCANAGEEEEKLTKKPPNQAFDVSPCHISP